MTTREAVTQAMDEGLSLKDDIVRRAVELAGCTEGTGYKMYLDVMRRKNEIPSPVQVTEGHSFDDLREKHDNSLLIPRKIREAISKYLLPRKWLYEYEFRELTGVSTAKWRRYADAFPEYQSTIDGKVIWHDPELKEEIERIKAT